MSELCTLAASVVLQSQPEASSTKPIQSEHPLVVREFDHRLQPSVGCDGHGAIAPLITPEPLDRQDAGSQMEFSAYGKHRLNPLPDPAQTPGIPTTLPPTTRLPSAQPVAARPRSGGQLFQQRLAALQAGRTYTRLPSNSFATYWQQTNYHPTYQDWLNLLAREARSMAGGQGNNPLTIIVGDSLSLWMPTEFLPNHRFWLNQSISGETAAGMVRRLYMFDQTRPDVIHVMAGINDLKNGATDAEVLTSLQTMMHQLRHRHPYARVVMHSILPTRLPHLPSDRIRRINHQLAQMAHHEGTHFLNLQGHFSDGDGHLRQDLTTDGLHLNYRGYTLWQAAMNQAV